jgi:hypothetical protein
VKEPPIISSESEEIAEDVGISALFRAPISQVDDVLVALGHVRRKLSTWDEQFLDKFP